MKSRYRRNPLEIPEIRIRISQFITRKDALACILVCKAWAEDFIPSIWHTIDYNVHTRFEGLNKDIIKKHGQHIRAIQNIQSGRQVDTTQNSSISRLTSISVILNTNPRFLVYIYDILRRNNSSLKKIDLTKPFSSVPLYFAVDSLLPTASTSRLSHLKLIGISMTRDAFSALLRASPVLNTIDLQSTSLFSNLITDIYQHPNVKSLIASIHQAFKVDSSQNAPSLFVHFPKLTTWSTWSTTTQLGLPPEVSASTIVAEISQQCPILSSLYMSLPGSILVDILSQELNNLKCVCFPHKSFTPLLTMAVLMHKETLESVMTYTGSTIFYESVDVHSVDNHFQEDGWTVQVMISLCPHLKAIKFPLLEMNIGDIEKIGWSCDNLRELYIRIFELDTKEKIDRTIRLWLDARSKKYQIRDLGVPLQNGQSNLSLEQRVARHLLKFEKLKEVWLGTYVCRVK